MKSCPVCLANDVQLSHRRSILEHGPLTWIGILPFRCGQCQTRFYMFASSDPRRKRRGADTALATERRRAPRWTTHTPVMVTVHTPGEADVVLEGTAVNTSLEGTRLRLPVLLPEGAQLTVALEGAQARPGSVRWSHPHGEAGSLHGIRFQVPLERSGVHSRPLRWVILRRLLRRGLIALIGLAAIAIAAYGLLWLVNGLQTYDPKFYEPKDIERERYQTQGRPEGSRPAQ